MRILVLNIPNTLNYGSMMMAENLFYYLKKELPDEEVEFVVVTDKPEETLLRFSSALEGIELKLNTIDPSKVIKATKFSMLFGIITGVGVNKYLAREVQDIDGVFVLGGDDFTEDYGYLGPIKALIRLNVFIKAGKKVLFVGQTIGPFKSWRRLLIKHLISNMTEIIAREPITFNYLRHVLNLKNVSLGSDIAFLPLARQAEHGPIIKKSYNTIVPSELIWRFASEKNREAYIHFLTDIGTYLTEKFSDLQLLILPHVLFPDKVDDTLAGRDLYLALRRKGISPARLHFEERILLPYQARRLLAQSYLVVTGRMHAAISSLACNVPALSLSYSRKYWGIIGEDLKMSELIIDVRDKPWSKIRELALKKLQNIICDYDKIKIMISEKMPSIEGSAYDVVRKTKNIILLRQG